MLKIIIIRKYVCNNKEVERNSWSCRGLGKVEGGGCNCRQMIVSWMCLCVCVCRNASANVTNALTWVFNQP